MESITRLSPEKSGNLIFESHPYSYLEISTELWKKLRLIFIVVLPISAILLFIIDNVTIGVILLFITLLMVSGIILSFVNWDRYSNKFIVYENGFAGNIGKRYKDPNTISVWSIGQRFVRYDEIDSIRKISPIKNNLLLSLIYFVRIDIAPHEKRYSCFIPNKDVVRILPEIYLQSKDKGMNLKIDDDLKKIHCR